MKNIWETCVFSDEIISGNLELYKFAVELHQFLEGKADPVYQDPELFFKNTFLTTQMKLILKDSLLRLTKGSGTPVTVIDTGFGGGKTHTILLLYHIYNNKDLGLKYISKYDFEKEYAISSIPEIQMITIDCRQIKKNTLWGEIAYKIGKYEEIEHYDINKQPIHDIDIIKSFFSKPTLLLLDELPHYLLGADAEKVGNVSLADLTKRFVLDLASVVSTTKYSCLILTLTEKQQLYEKYTESLASNIKTLRDYQADEIYSGLKESLSRQAQFTIPVTQEQAYDIIRTRLVKKFDDDQRNKTIKTYFSYFYEKGLISDLEYEDKMLSAYPFHPFLIDTLYERVSTLPNFNRTRGILRLLGMVLHDIYKNKKDCLLVSTSEINLTQNEIKGELTSKLDIDLRQVIDTDCIRHSQNLDSTKNIKIVEKIARTIYIYSLIGSSKKSGIRPSSLKLAICYPNIDTGLVDKALDEIEKEFWYLKSEGGEYYFDEAPNINKIIHENQREVTKNELRSKIEQALDGLLPKSNDITVIIWDEGLLEDSEKLKIFVVDYEKNIDDESLAKSFMNKLLEYLPNGNIREKQNTIVFLYADKDGIDSMKEKSKILCAIERAKKDERIKVDKEYITKINARLEQSKGDLSAECFNVYCKIGYPNGPNPLLRTLSAMDTKRRNMTEAIVDLLKEKGKLIEELSDDGIPEIQKADRISKIYDLFKVDKSKKFVLGAGGILDACKMGVINGKFGYADKLNEKDGKYVGTIGKSNSIQWEGWLINKDFVYQEKGIVIEKKDEKPNVTTLFNYMIECDSVKEIINTLEKLSIVLVDTVATKDFRAEFKMEPDTTITFKSQLERHQEVKNLMQIIQSRVSGRGTIIINSQNDLKEEFDKYEIKGNVI